MSATSLEQAQELPRRQTIAGWVASVAPGAARRLSTLRPAAPFALIAVIALWSRLRYAVFAYHDTYGSGDADLILTKAFFMSRGEWRPPGNVGAPAALFGDPPLIPLIFAGAERVAGIPLAIAPLFVTPALTIVALLALFAVLRRAFDLPVALLSACMIALLPRFSFDSTEPDKVGFVLSFFLISLFFLYEAQERPWLYLVAGLFMGLSVFSHNTGYLFLPVYVFSHAALSRGSRRRLFDLHFLASVVITLLFIGTYAGLNDHFKGVSVASGPIAISAPLPASPDAAPAPAVSAAPHHGHRFVPASIQGYWDTVTGLGRNRFEGSAWNIYFNAIRFQVTRPVYVMAIAGFVVGLGSALRRRRYEVVPLLLWMMLVTLEFAIQYPSFSHVSRYPSYVTPVFVAFGCFFLVWLARLLTSRMGVSTRRWYATAVAVPVVAFIATAYLTAPNPGLRRNYAPSKDLAAYVTANRLLDDNDLLYLGWPVVTFNILSEQPQYEPRLHAFGWGSVRLSSFSPSYLADHHVSYYAHDHTGSDYFQSADVMLALLSRDFNLETVRFFCPDGVARTESVPSCGHYVVLYRLIAKTS